jgi:chromosomal replication initiator protein
MLKEKSSLDERELFAQGLQSYLKSNQYNTWFHSTTYMGVYDGIVQLEVSNSYVEEWIRSRYTEIVLKVVNSFRSDANEISFLLKNKESPEFRGSLVLKPIPSSFIDINKTKKSYSAEDLIQQGFYPEYTFDSYVSGSSNEIAFTAAKTVAISPGQNEFNPLVIYGGSGLGKTHLLQAIGFSAIENNPCAKVVYKTAETFLREYIRYIVKEKKSASFYKKYSDADILLIDDIHFFAKKVQTQEEFFKILSSLSAMKKQIVITCDQKPAFVKGLSSRLLAKFDTGLTVDVLPPDKSTRIKILTRKLNQRLNVSQGIDTEVIEYLASRYTANIRELEGTLVKLIGFSTLFGASINLEVAKQVLNDVARNSNAPLTISKIITVCADHFNISENQIVSKSRMQCFSLPRKVAMYLCRSLTENSLNTIGLNFNRDYATVIASLKSVSKLLESDSDLNKKIEIIREELKAN